MQLLPAVLAQATPAPASVGRFMADPFVQGLVLGVAATALFAFVAIVIAGAFGRMRTGTKGATATSGSAIATPIAPVPVASSVPVAGPAADRNPLGSFSGIDPRHLAIIAAAATVALGHTRVRRVTRVAQVPTASGSAWTTRGESGSRLS